MNMPIVNDNAQWSDLREHLERVIENEARLFSDAELQHLDSIVSLSDKTYAARLAADFLKNSPLNGELLDIYADRLGAVIGHPLKIRKNKRTPIEDRSAWVTNPRAKTFEIGW